MRRALVDYRILPPLRTHAFHAQDASTDSVVFLFDDAHGSRQFELHRAGYTCTTHICQHTFSNAFVDHVIRQLVAQKPVLLWISLPGTGCANHKKDRRRSEHLGRMVREHLHANRHVDVEANARKCSWELSGVEQLIRDRRMHLMRFRWCRFDVTCADSGLPSCTVTRVLSTLPMKAMDSCTHPQHARNNARDYHLALHQTVRVHQQLAALVVAALRSSPATNFRSLEALPEHTQVATLAVSSGLDAFTLYYTGLTRLRSSHRLCTGLTRPRSSHRLTTCPGRTR